MVESVDTRDLKSSAFALCGFKSAPGTIGKYRIIKAISSVVKPPTGGFVLYFRLLIPFRQPDATAFSVNSCLTVNFSFVPDKTIAPCYYQTDSQPSLPEAACSVDFAHFR